MPDSPSDKETLSSRAQLVRLFEASARIEFPTKDELNFRLSLMKAIGLAFNLREMRKVEILGPADKDTPRPARAAR